MLVNVLHRKSFHSSTGLDLDRGGCCRPLIGVWHKGTSVQWDFVLFTKGGKPIPEATLRHAFDWAAEDAKVARFRLQGFQTLWRWAALAVCPSKLPRLGWAISSGE